MLSYYSQLASITAINALLALAAYLPLLSGDLVLTMGSAMGLGAIAAGSIAGGGGGPATVLLALLAGGCVGGLFMSVTASLVRRMNGFILAITTVAIAELVRVLVQNQPALGGALGFRIDVVNPSVLWPLGGLFVVLLFIAFFERSPMRRAVALVSDSSRVAATLGVNPVRTRAWMMTAGGAIAGVAGGLYMINLGIIDTRHFGFEGGIQVVVFAVVGGTRRATGPLLAAASLTLIPEFLRLTSSYRMLLYGAVLIAVMILRPEGVWLWKRRPTDAQAQ